MHPKLKEYVARFVKTEISAPETFYTSFSSPIEAFSQLPYLFEIQNFCLRLLLASLQQDKICIYSDYDTDAVTATASMYWGLIDLGFSKDLLSYYAPDRFTEGYGMNTEAVEKLSLENNLIISVDCGINSVLEAEVVGGSANCDLIITDHHSLTGQIPAAVAVINPRLSVVFKEDEKLKTARLKYGKLKTEKLVQQLNSQNLSPDQQAKIQEFLEICTARESNPNSSESNYLSSSVTGVGVAWFSLVWLCYFLEWLETDSSTK